jgi:hypothetical protein
MTIMNKYSDTPAGKNDAMTLAGISNLTILNSDRYFTKVKEINDAQETFEDTVNLLCKIGTDSNIMANTLAHTIAMQHRTHQQSIIKTLHSTLKAYAAIALTDPRNEVAVAWAKKVTTDEEFFPYI